MLYNAPQHNKKITLDNFVITKKQKTNQAKFYPHKKEVDLTNPELKRSVRWFVLENKSKNNWFVSLWKDSYTNPATLVKANQNLITEMLKEKQTEGGKSNQD